MVRYRPLWKVSHFRKNAKGEYESIWSEEIDKNILYDTGEQMFLSSIFARGLTNYGILADPAVYLGLARMPLAEADTIVNVQGEPWNGGGYARKSLPVNGTGISGQPFYVVQPGAYFEVNSDVRTWIATANWNPVNILFLVSSLTANADVANAHLIAAVALSTERTLMTDDQLNASIIIGMSE